MTRKPHIVPGHVARMITVILERVVAGDDPKSVCADYDFEWGHGPDMTPLVRLVELRESLRPLADRLQARGEPWNSVRRALVRCRIPVTRWHR